MLQFGPTDDDLSDYHKERQIEVCNAIKANKKLTHLNNNCGSEIWIRHIYLQTHEQHGHHA